MKAGVLIFTILIVSFLTSLTAFSAGIDPGKVGVMYVCGFPYTVKLDGNLDDWPSVVSWHKVPCTRGTQPAPDDKDASYEFACVADADFLYVAFKVYDDTKVVDENTGCDVWKDDSVEVYIDGGNEKAKAYDANDSQVTIGRDNIGGDINKPKLGGCVGALQGPTTGAKAAVVDTDYGWAVEAALPFATWKITPKDGLVIGFNTHLNDDDDKGERDHKLIWSEKDIADSSWSDPSVFGELKFVRTDFAVSPESKLATTWASVKVR